MGRRAYLPVLPRWRVSDGREKVEVPAAALRTPLAVGGRSPAEALDDAQARDVQQDTAGGEAAAGAALAIGAVAGGTRPGEVLRELAVWT